MPVKDETVVMEETVIPVEDIKVCIMVVMEETVITMKGIKVCTMVVMEETMITMEGIMVCDTVVVEETLITIHYGKGILRFVSSLKQVAHSAIFSIGGIHRIFFSVIP